MPAVPRVQGQPKSYLNKIKENTIQEGSPGSFFTFSLKYSPFYIILFFSFVSWFILYLYKMIKE